MDREALTSNYLGRLDDFIHLAQSGVNIQLLTRVYRKFFKETKRSSTTDDIDIEMDRCMLMADFTPTRVSRGIPSKVSKVYMICPVNETDVDLKTSYHVANERLRMDFSRLREAGVECEEKFFYPHE